MVSNALAPASEAKGSHVLSLMSLLGGMASLATVHGAGMAADAFGRKPVLVTIVSCLCLGCLAVAVLPQGRWSTTGAMCGC